MSDVRNQAARAGIGLGSAIAVTVSWSLHKSLVWAIIPARSISWWEVMVASDGVSLRVGIKYRLRRMMGSPR